MLCQYEGRLSISIMALPVVLSLLEAKSTYTTSHISNDVGSALIYETQKQISEEES
jgi:hypothetical protein